jgi:hypothetical protein
VSFTANSDPTLAFGSSRIIPLGTWTPQPGHLNINSGHVCLGANCFPASPNDGGAAIPPGGGILVPCDVHHGQLNLQVLPALPGGHAQIPMIMQHPRQ